MIIYLYIKIGLDDLIVYMNEFREVVCLEFGDKVLIILVKVLVNMVYWLIMEEGLLEKVKEEFREV